MATIGEILKHRKRLIEAECNEAKIELHRLTQELSHAEKLVIVLEEQLALIEKQIRESNG